MSSRPLDEPIAYREHIRNSLGEFSVAREQYVIPRSGWFSDRSVCYLACGRPVIMQDTGFGKFIPPGMGLLAYGTIDEAQAALDAIASDYPAHSKAAVEIAREYFDADKVVGGILQRVGLL
jgi:glycosyltransferase involved in cell wall biosynthesis